VVNLELPKNLLLISSAKYSKNTQKAATFVKSNNINLYIYETATKRGGVAKLMADILEIIQER